MTRRWILLVALFVAASVAWFLPRDAPPQRGSSKSPAAFELSRYNDARVAVHLRGGPVEFEGGKNFGADTGKPTTGTVHGRVLDRDGKPVANVIVLGGSNLLEFGESLIADAGVRTDEEGRFTLKTYADEVTVVALDHARGMSPAPRVKVGAGVDLSLEPFTWIEGFVREGNAPVEGRVWVETSDLTTTYIGRTDASGHYMMGPLPPGTYAVRAHNDDPDVVIALPTITVELDPGTTTTQSMIESDPGLVSVEFHRPPGIRTIDPSVTLLEGDAPVRTHTELEAILRGEVKRNVYGTTTVGGKHPRKVFRGIPLGRYSACAQFNLGDEGFHVSCQAVDATEVGAGHVDIRLRAG